MQKPDHKGGLLSFASEPSLMVGLLPRIPIRRELHQEILEHIQADSESIISCRPDIVNGNDFLCQRGFRFLNTMRTKPGSSQSVFRLDATQRHRRDTAKRDSY